MELSEIRFVEAAGPGETLALSLMSVAASAGIHIDYDDLCAALGLSCTAVSVAAEPSLGAWMAYGRDAFVEPAARLFGIEVRDLQPPDVAVEMAEAEEFEQHWEYSYKPLIRRALEHGQPVLAWRGWEEIPYPEWGIVTAQQGNDFSGWTMGSTGKPLILNRPAFQCYVVERIDVSAALPPNPELLRLAIKHMDAYMNSTPLSPPVSADVKPAVTTGPAAFDAWTAWIESVSFDSQPWIEHQRHANRIAAGHESAAKSLRRMAESATPDLDRGIGQVVARCTRISHWLHSSHDPGRWEAAFHTAHGRGELTKLVHEVSLENYSLANDIRELSPSQNG